MTAAAVVNRSCSVTGAKNLHARHTGSEHARHTATCISTSRTMNRLHRTRFIRRRSVMGKSSLNTRKKPAVISPNDTGPKA